MAISVLGDSLYVAPFRGNKKAALSITFDDNLAGQFNYGLPILNALGLKATFFAIAGQRPYSLLQTAASTGHEIGSHSWSHTDLTLANTNLTRELRESKDSLSMGLGGQSISTIAWPLGKGGGSRPAEAIIRDSAKAYYLGARNASIGPSKCEPANTRRYFQIGSVLMDGNITQIQFERNLDTAIQQKGYQILLYHAIEDPGYAMVPSSNFSQQMAAIAQRQDSLWVAPFGSVVKYIRQKNAASITNVQFNTGAGCTNCTLNFDFQVADTTPVVYSPEPMTLVYKFKNSNLDISGIDFNNASFIQPSTGRIGSCRWLPADSALIIDSVLPGAIQVNFFPNGLAEVVSTTISLSGNPFGLGLKVSNVQISSPLNWQLIDATGRNLIQKTLGANEGFVVENGLPSGVYTIRVFNAEFIKAEKFVVLH